MDSVFYPAMSRALLFPLSVLLLALAAMSCDQAALNANQAQVQAQQTQIEQMQQEIASMKAQQQSFPPSQPAPPPGSCDREIMARATKQGGDKYASGDFSKALGYYQDALSACPGNARAELNVGRVYEALNDRGNAQTYYQQAASSSDPAEQAAESEAHTALSQLGGASR